MKPGKRPTEQPRLDLRELWKRLGEEPPGPINDRSGDDARKVPRPRKPAA